MFSVLFFSLLVYGALLACSLLTVLLLFLAIREAIRGTLW